LLKETGGSVEELHTPPEALQSFLPQVYKRKGREGSYYGRNNFIAKFVSASGNSFVALAEMR
jgi:hypothetical protein